MRGAVQIIDREGWKYARVPRAKGEGKSVTKSLHTQSETEAREKIRASGLEQIALAAKADALTREVWTRLLAGKRITVSGSLKAFHEHRVLVGGAPGPTARQVAAIEQMMLAGGLAHASIAAVETRHVADWINRAGPEMLSTRQWWLNSIKSWLGWCVAQRWLVVNPAEDVIVKIDGLTQEQLISVPHAAFTEGEVLTLLSQIPKTDFWHGAVLLGYHFGLRLGAVATLEDVNVVAHELKLYTRKGRRMVHERLPDELIEWFDLWRTVKPESTTDYLFPQQAAIYLSSSALLSCQFRRLLDKHGLPARVFHGLRRTATARRWSAELDELGDEDKRRLMSLVAREGFAKVQRLLAHAPGSDTTESYMPRA